MRKRYRVLVLAALVAALVVPVGFALSLESDSVNASHGAGIAAATVAAPLSVTRVSSAVPSPASMPDAAKLLLVGTSLFGLAAAVRKAA